MKEKKISCLFTDKKNKDLLAMNFCSPECRYRYEQPIKSCGYFNSRPNLVNQCHKVKRFLREGKAAKQSDFFGDALCVGVIEDCGFIGKKNLTEVNEYFKSEALQKKIALLKRLDAESLLRPGITTDEVQEPLMPSPGGLSRFVLTPEGYRVMGAPAPLPFQNVLREMEETFDHI
jgi:hypothetical protein